jgi:hypothetical protein
VITYDIGDITSDVKKVPLVYKDKNHTEIFGGYGIYDPRSNQVVCQVSDTASFIDNKSLIKPLEKIGWKFLYANVNNARTLYHMSGLLTTTLTDNDNIPFESGIEITNSYNNSYATENRLFFYSVKHNIILRTSIPPTTDPSGISTFKTIIALSKNPIEPNIMNEFIMPRKVRTKAFSYISDNANIIEYVSYWTILKAIGYACHSVWEKSAYMSSKAFMANLIHQIINRR